MKLTAVVTCHARHDNLRHILASLAAQTRPPDETLAYLSGVTTGVVDMLVEDHPHVHFVIVPDRQDWGHDKRASGLAIAAGDVIGWFNDDDAYHHDYAARLMAELEAGADVAYCDWTGAPRPCAFASGASDAGNFLVRTSIARQAGWTGRGYEADGQFIDRVRGLAGRIVHVPEVLYTHNPDQ